MSSRSLIQFVIACVVAGGLPTRAATITVTNNADSGTGSFRQAILTANASVSVPDVIQFNIPSPNPVSIPPLTPLPDITDPVVINGYSQPGASSNTLAVGNNAVLGIVIPGKLVIDTSNTTVRGLSIQQIQVGAATGPKGGNVIEGCFIGLDASGTNSLNSPGAGVFVQTPNNRIGGTVPGARNLISSNATTGIEIFESFATNNLVQGNYIGTDRTGTKAMGNTDRALVVNMNASANTIGGTAAGAGNVISGNLDRGITLDGANNRVQGNFIGTDASGTLPLGNARSGIEVGGSGNTVGGTNSGAPNVIAFNGVNGNGFTTNGVDVKVGTTGYSISANSIYDNYGLGIDVNANFLPTPGYPVLTVASNTPPTTLIRGTHTPGATFRLELFLNPICDPSGYGEGRTLLTVTNITTDGSGNFALNWPATITPGMFLTATANGATEFSQCRMVVAAGRTNSWTNSIGGKWEVGPNWSLGVPPYGGHTLVMITNSTTKIVTNDATTASGFPSTMIISNLIVSAPGGATNTLLLAHGSTSTPLRILKTLALNNGGKMLINNAALSLEGSSSDSSRIDGALTLNDGSLTVTNSSQFYIGSSGSGSLTVSNGTLRAYYPIVGINPGANGTWHIAGGTNIVTQVFDIADSLTATGTVRMTGGLLSAPNLYVGLFGNGSLIVSNGIFQCAGQVDVASQPGAVGNFTAAGGGVCTVGNMIVTEGAGATGSVLVTDNASVEINGPLDNAGSVHVAGGNLAVLGQLTSDTLGNSIKLTGGTLSVTNDNSFLTQVTVSNGTFLGRDFFLGNQKVGVFGIAGGTVALPGLFNNGFIVGGNGGTGTVWQAGGQLLLTNTDLNVGGLFSAATGRMIISNGLANALNLYVGGQGGGTGIVTMVGGTVIASNLEVNAGSTFTLNSGTLQTRTANVANNTPFAVGDGTNSAVYNLLGGTNTFLKGLRIATNGMLTGNGTIFSGVTNSGVIAPGGSAGRIDILGSLVLSNSSELRFEIGGYAQTTQYDFIRVATNTTLGGTLSASLSNNFQSVMTNGASFTVLSNGTTFTGAFANVASGGTLTTTDGYARFTVLYAGTNNMRLTSLAIVDTDGDTIPDWWEDQYGLNKNVAADAALDTDGDGASNLNEFRAGTIPTNAASVFRIVSLQRATNNLRVTWTTVGGKSYRLQTNATPLSGSLTTNFSDFGSLIIVPGVGESTTNALDTGAATNGRANYYRVRLGP